MRQLTIRSSRGAACIIGPQAARLGSTETGDGFHAGRFHQLLAFGIKFALTFAN